jgi:hypothetical protein
MNSTSDWIDLGDEGHTWIKHQLESLAHQSVRDVDSLGVARTQFRWTIQAANLLIARIDRGSARVFRSDDARLEDLASSSDREAHQDALTFANDAMLDWFCTSDGDSSSSSVAVIPSPSYYASDLHRWMEVIAPAKSLKLITLDEAVYGVVELSGAIELRRADVEAAIDNLCLYPPCVAIGGGLEFAQICSRVSKNPTISEQDIIDICDAVTKVILKDQVCAGRYITWTSDVR